MLVREARGAHGLQFGGRTPIVIEKWHGGGDWSMASLFAKNMAHVCATTSFPVQACRCGSVGVGAVALRAHHSHGKKWTNPDC